MIGQLQRTHFQFSFLLLPSFLATVEKEHISDCNLNGRGQRWLWFLVNIFAIASQPPLLPYLCPSTVYSKLSSQKDPFKQKSDYIIVLFKASDYFPVSHGRNGENFPIAYETIAVSSGPYYFSDLISYYYFPSLCVLVGIFWRNRAIGYNFIYIL